MFIALLLAGMGALAFVGGIVTLRRARAFRSRALSVPGILAGIHIDRHNDRRTNYPVLRFRTRDGVDIQTTSNVNERPLYLSRMRGRQVTVLYDPENPRMACIDGPSGRGQVRSAYGVIALGTLFLLAAIGYIAFRQL